VRQLTVALSAVAVAIVLALLGVFLWLRGYQPLAASRPIRPGPGLGADVEPTFGSGGKTVYIPVYRPGRVFTTTFTLRNSGRFAVDLDGVDPGGGPLVPTGVPTLRLDPHDTAIVTVDWRLACPASRPAVTTDHVRIRYRYLSVFTRTQSVELPFAVTLRCHGGPPPVP
jgi:hypothetical protein